MERLFLQVDVSEVKGTEPRQFLELRDDRLNVIELHVKARAPARAESKSKEIELKNPQMSPTPGQNRTQKVVDVRFVEVWSGISPEPLAPGKVKVENLELGECGTQFVPRWSPRLVSSTEHGEVAVQRKAVDPEL
jgi:hypothetical protein